MHEPILVIGNNFGYKTSVDKELYRHKISKNWRLIFQNSFFTQIVVFISPQKKTRSK